MFRHSLLKADPRRVEPRVAVPLPRVILAADSLASGRSSGMLLATHVSSLTAAREALTCEVWYRRRDATEEAGEAGQYLDNPQR
jgi:hypothetical protein